MRVSVSKRNLGSASMAVFHIMSRTSRGMVSSADRRGVSSCWLALVRRVIALGKFDNVW